MEQAHRCLLGRSPRKSRYGAFGRTHLDERPHQSIIFFRGGGLVPGRPTVGLVRTLLPHLRLHRISRPCAPHRIHDPTRHIASHAERSTLDDPHPNANANAEARWREGRERARRAARVWSRSPTAGRCPLATNTTVACATPDLLLKRTDKTFTIYV